MSVTALEAISAYNDRFVAQALKSSARMDGRSGSDWRHVDIRTGKDHAIVQIGGTVACAWLFTEMSESENVTSKIRSARDKHNIFRTSVEYSDYTRFSSPNAAVLSHQLFRLLKNSRCIDIEALENDDKIKKLDLTVRIMSNDGNVVDAVNIAAVSVLMLFSQKLSVHHVPVSSSFGIMLGSEDSEPILLADATYQEERVISTTICIAVNQFGEVCFTEFIGGNTLDSATIDRCVKLAIQRSKTIYLQIKCVEEVARDSVAASEAEKLAAELLEGGL